MLTASKRAKSRLMVRLRYISRAQSDFVVDQTRKDWKIVLSWQRGLYTMYVWAAHANMDIVSSTLSEKLSPSLRKSCHLQQRFGDI